MHLGIIGAGVMGEVIVSSLLKKNVLSAEEITISDFSENRLADLHNEYGIGTTPDNLELVAKSDMVIFAVKPQNSASMMEPLAGHFKPEQVVVSIMAGVSLDTIGRIIKHKALVRSMPNIPAQIGEGMTVWIASDEVSDSSRMIVKMVFQAFGLESSVEDEDMIDAATAVSGSGPAYIFYFAENLVKAAKDLGFDEMEATRLVQQTFRGAMDLWYTKGDTPENLRRSVTSKGGTTAAALRNFKASNTRKVFSDAIKAAYIRAGQLREIADGHPDPGGPEAMSNGEE